MSLRGLGPGSILFGAALLALAGSGTSAGGPQCFGMAASIVGDPGGGVIRGTDGNDVIVGSAANDEIYTGRGVDLVCAGGEDDVVIVSVLLGNDRIDLGDGDDEIAIAVESAANGVTAAGVLLPASFRGGVGSDEVSLEGNTGRRIVAREAAAGRADFFVKRGRANLMTADIASIETVRGSVADDVILDEDHREVVNLRGGAGNDDIYGSDQSDIIYDEDGTDYVSAGDGDDVVRPGRGDDSYIGGPGVDLLDLAGARAAVFVDLEEGVARSDAEKTLSRFDDVRGSRFDDTLWGNDDANKLDGGPGDDTLRPREGNDTVIGGPGLDRVEYAELPADGGPPSAGRFVSGVKVNLVTGLATGAEAGRDSLSGLESVFGSVGPDTITGDAVRNVIEGGDGNDTIEAGAGNDVSLGGPGADTIEEFTGNNAIEGGPGDDTIMGGDQRDVIQGGDGNDTINGGIGLDTVFGHLKRQGPADGPDNDTITDPDGAILIDGGPGDDTIGAPINGDKGRVLGGDGNDILGAKGILSGGKGNDILSPGFPGDTYPATFRGGPGNDTFKPGGGDDTVDGGPGMDFVSYSDSGDGFPVTIDLNSGTSGNHTIGLDSLTNIEDAEGSFNGMDTIIGTDARNRLYGLNNNDRLFGGGGNDLLVGGDNDDELDGGGGTDRVIGGKGFDFCEGEAVIDCEGALPGGVAR
jgi:Ca2+-binding RTX toxin-like protein